VWCWTYSSTNLSLLNYSASDCFETFPAPLGQIPFRYYSDACVERSSERYHEYRSDVMIDRNEGLTSLYNRFHDMHETAADIRKLRHLHAEMDNAVAAAYDWSELHLGHGFHETKQGIRFTISEPARREVLARLLKLNHERYAEEVEQGLHGKKTGKRGAWSVERGASEMGKSGASERGKRGASEPRRRGHRSKPAPSGPGLNLGDDDDDTSSAADSDVAPLPEPQRSTPHPDQPDRHVQRPHAPRSTPHAPRSSPADRPIPIDELDTDAIMAAFRQAARNRGWLDRDELLKGVSLILGYERKGPKIDESLRGHLRAAIRRGIIQTDGPSLVHAGAGTMSDYSLDDLRETFRSVMRKDTFYEREDVIHTLASYLGFVRVTGTIRQPIRSAINSAIRHGLLGYEGSMIWRSE
jgi:hypothetical protein